MEKRANKSFQAGAGTGSEEIFRSSAHNQMNEEYPHGGRQTACVQ